MRINLKIFLLSLTIAMLPSFASIANACSCIERLPSEAYAGASLVFVGVATETSFEATSGRLPTNAISTTMTNGRPVTIFKVEEAFLGGNVAEISISGGGTTCDSHFAQGKRYLIYAYQGSDGKTFYTDICSGTSPLEEAKAHIKYLRKVSSLPVGGTVFGRIYRELLVKKGSDYVPVAMAEVVLENGSQSFRAISNAKGLFELNGLPQGRYRARTNPPTNYSGADVSAKWPRNEWELDVPGHGSLQISFTARFEGEISGAVSDVSGFVTEDIEPELIPVDDAMKDRFWSVRLGELNSFKFTFVAPGRYYLGFNMRSGPSLEQPYPEFYYPGVEDRSKASIINVDEGQKITGLSLIKPLRLGERMIEGVAVMPNGRPFVSSCGIKLTNPRTGYREGNCVSTDSQGHFMAKAIEGQTYELSATITNGKSVGLISSKPLLIKVGKENKPVKLIVELP